MSSSKDIDLLEPSGKSEEAGHEDETRANWGGQLEFILTIVGYAVGLGNVWRFPYLCYQNGGGAFLIPYFLMLALIGMPIFFMELGFGQFASLSPIKIWTQNPMMKGLGYAMVITNTLMVIYYNVIISWSLYFFFASMTAEPMPWEVCDNDFNTYACVTENISMYYRENNITANFTHNGEFFSDVNDLHTASEEYFYLGVLQISSGIDTAGSVVWYLALTLLLAWLIVFLVLIKGIQSLGKVVYFSSIFPYVLLTIMLIRGVTLEGAAEGIKFYLQPKWDRLLDATVWSQAATQIFFSLSTCTGGLIAMASYNKFNNNCLRDSIMVPLINCGTSFYAGFVIFSVLGFMSVRKGVSVDEVAADGPGLVFVVYPEGLSQMPVTPLWSVLFFLMLITLGFSSSFSMTECFFSSLVDEWPQLNDRKTNIIFRAVLCIVFYLIGLSMVTQGGFYVFNLYDVYLGSFPLLFIGLFECSVISWWYKYRRFADDIYMMLGKKPSIFFKVMWKFITPILLFLIIIMTAIQWTPPTLDIFSVYQYPPWAEGLGWIIVVTPLIFIPLLFVTTLIKEGGWEIIKSASQPAPEWGPFLKSDRIGTRYEREGDKQVVATTDASTFKTNGSYTNQAYMATNEVHQNMPPSYSEDFTAL